MNFGSLKCSFLVAAIMIFCIFPCMPAVSGTQKIKPTSIIAGDMRNLKRFYRRQKPEYPDCSEKKGISENDINH